MSARKPSRRQNHPAHTHVHANSHNQNHNYNHHLRNPSLSHIHHLSNPQPSDYESDNAYDSSVPYQTLTTAPPPPPRTTSELNLSVIQRHSPAVSSILSISPYSVVYAFNASNSSWEKSGIEGSLFVCQLYPGPYGEDRYAVIVLNRRGLENFEAELREGGDVEITDDFIILKTRAQTQTQTQALNGEEDGIAGEEKIIGLWIFSEPPPSSTAETRAIHGGLIKECATSAGESRKMVEENTQAYAYQNGHSRHPTESSWSGPGPTEAEAASQVTVQELFQRRSGQNDNNNYGDPNSWIQSTQVQYHTQLQQISPNPPPAHTHATRYHEPEPYQPGEWQFRQNGQRRAQHHHQTPQPEPQSQSQPAPQEAVYQSFPQQQQQPGHAQNDILGDLFRRAGLGYGYQGS